MTRFLRSVPSASDRERDRISNRWDVNRIPRRRKPRVYHGTMRRTGLLVLLLASMAVAFAACRNEIDAELSTTTGSPTPPTMVIDSSSSGHLVDCYEISGASL